MKSIQQLKKDLSVFLNDQAVADPEEFQGFARTPSPHPPIFKCPMKMNNWVSVRPNYFFFIGYLGKMR